MRAETRPEGSEAVESVQVSGWVMGGVQEEVAEYQAWNWWMGEEGWRSERERAPLVNWLICSASSGVVSVVRPGVGVGATVVVLVVWRRGTRQIDLQISLAPS